MMTKRSVALLGVLIVMAMIGSSVIGAVSAIAASDTANGSFSVFLPLILNAIGAMAEVPQGAVMTFNLASCPSGWTEVTDAQGRAIVGLPSGGTVAGTVGSPLANLENRTHTHEVNPASTSTTSNGSHEHGYDTPPGNTSFADIGEHTHSINPPSTNTNSNSHRHVWSYNTSGEDWRSYGLFGGVVDIVNWGDGMDSSGSGYFPLAVTEHDGTQYFYTEYHSHSHSVDIAPFDSSPGGAEQHQHTFDPDIWQTFPEGDHTHSVNIPNTISSTASTSDVMPYIQFLVCEKD